MHLIIRNHQHRQHDKTLEVSSLKAKKKRTLSPLSFNTVARESSINNTGGGGGRREEGMTTIEDEAKILVSADYMLAN